MPDIWLDVDVALANVPINTLPLIDDTDFTTIEAALVYNQAGLVLNWHFVTSAGVKTTTAVTPTTAGVYDWTDDGTSGTYSIEIPASGGASANNDTEGTGWFTGVATGVLPWAGPRIGFRAAALNNALIDGGDVLDVSVTELGGVAQSLTDLKDFADAGYDPATNKVQGVVLVDTTTALTNVINASSVVASVTAGVTLAAGAVTNASLAGNMEIVFETDFATNYNTTRNGWVTNYTDYLGTIPAAALGADCITSAKIADGAFVAANFAASSLAGKGDWNIVVPDAAGVAPTATEIVDEFETQSQANPTGFHVNMMEANSDTAMAANLANMYNGTGYVDGSAPATQDQLDGIANVGSAVHQSANGQTETTVGTTVNSYTATEELDGIYYQIPDNGAGVMDVEILFNIGSGTPASFQVTGYLSGSNDSLNVKAYDYVTSGFKQVGTLQGSNSATNTIHIYELFVGMVGSGANEGDIRIQFEKPSGLSSAQLNIDQIFAAFNQGSEGYDNGAVWLDTTRSNTNTVVGIDGVARNAVSTIGAAVTLLAATNLHKIAVGPSSSFTLASTHDNEVFEGHEWTLALGSQSIAASMFIDADVTGTATGAESEWEDCIFNVVSLPAMQAYNCSFKATTSGGFTMSAAGDYRFINCQSGVAGSGSPLFTLGTGAITAEFRRWSGGIQVANISSDDVLTIGGELGTVTLGGADGTIEIRGTYKAIVDNRTGSPTLNVSGAIRGGSGEYTSGVVYDNVGGEAGAVSHFNGIETRASSVWADAQAIATAINVVDYHILNGATVTLDATSVVDHSFVGEHWTLALASRNISGIHVHGATVTGISTATTGYEFSSSELGSVTMDNDGHFHSCGLEGTFTVGQAGQFLFKDCFGTTDAPWILDFAALGATVVHLFNFFGDVTATNMAAGDVLHITGGGIISTATCTGGTIEQNGFFAYTDAGGNITKLQADIKNSVDAIETDTQDLQTQIGTAGTGLTNLGGMSTGMQAEVNAEADTALTDYDGPTRTEATADKNEIITYLGGVLTKGTSDSGTTTTMVDAARTEADTDYWAGDWIQFTSGTLLGQTRLITGFTPGTDTITFAPATTQAVGTHTYTIVPAANINLVNTVTTLTNLPAITSGWLTATGLATDAVDEIRDAILPTQNAAFNNIMFLFVAASDGVTPVTGATGTSVTRSIDGSAFGSGTGTLAEVANGIYQYDASAADMNGGVITFRFVGTGGTPGAPNDTFVTLVTGGGV